MPTHATEDGFGLRAAGGNSTRDADEACLPSRWLKDVYPVPRRVGFFVRTGDAEMLPCGIAVQHFAAAEGLQAKINRPFTLFTTAQFDRLGVLTTWMVAREDRSWRDVFRVGIGHDTHRLGEGGPLIVGGLKIDHDRHAIGHSDADVLLHAVTDAILGACSLGDIGELFPDTDPANQGKDSAEMLQAAAARMKEAGFRIVNLDCIVFAQRPKLSPHKPAIRERLAQILDVSSADVGVKAKTGESVGPIGREEAISAQCVALLATVDASG